MFTCEICNLDSWLTWVWGWWRREGGESDERLEGFRIFPDWSVHVNIWSGFFFFLIIIWVGFLSQQYQLQLKKSKTMIFLSFMKLVRLRLEMNGFVWKKKEKAQKRQRSEKEIIMWVRLWKMVLYKERDRHKESKTRGHLKELSQCFWLESILGKREWG